MLMPDSDMRGRRALAPAKNRGAVYPTHQGVLKLALQANHVDVDTATTIKIPIKSSPSLLCPCPSGWHAKISEHILNYFIFIFISSGRITRLKAGRASLSLKYKCTGNMRYVNKKTNNIKI
jgi:hypothetical protein